MTYCDACDFIGPRPAEPESVTAFREIHRTWHTIGRALRKAYAPLLRLLMPTNPTTKADYILMPTSPPPAPPVTYVLAPRHQAARDWCRANGVKPYARTTVIATRGPALLGCTIRPEDKVVFVGAGPSAEVLRDLDVARMGWAAQ